MPQAGPAAMIAAAADRFCPMVPGADATKGVIATALNFAQVLYSQAHSRAEAHSKTPSASCVVTEVRLNLMMVVVRNLPHEAAIRLDDREEAGAADTIAPCSVREKGHSERRFGGEPLG